jgi:hypothetical protein
MDRRQQGRSADGLQVTLDALCEALQRRRQTLIDLGQGRATRAMYEEACDRERRLLELWDRVSNAYYDQWCQDTRRRGFELTGWIMGRIRRSVGLDREPLEVDG